MERSRIHIVGSSIASRFGIEEPSWPELLAEKYKKVADVTSEIQYGLTYNRVIPMLSEVPHVELLVLHFGIAVGWPVSFRKVDIKLGTTPIKNEYAFHQPIGKGRSVKSRIKNRIKFRARNLLKYLLFMTGQYRPRVNTGDLEDQINAVISVAQSRAKEIVWIQHVPAWSMRTFVERWYYERYVKRIRWFAERNANRGVTFIIPEGPLVDAQNYALDTTHLSARGHREYAEFMSQVDAMRKLLV